ncbi:MAG: hypothetical protein ACI4U2_00550, partial [Christensenellaceae bacterium]
YSVQRVWTMWCMAMFFSAKCLVETLRFSPFAKQLIAKIGACTFGVYLTHTFLMDLGRVQSLLHSMAAHMNEMAAAILYCIVVLIVDYLAVWIVMQIPYVRKIVGGR